MVVYMALGMQILDTTESSAMPKGLHSTSSSATCGTTGVDTKVFTIGIDQLEVRHVV